MVRFTVLGRDFDLAPYKLGALIAAAPFLDAQKARTAEIEARAGVTVSLTDTPEERQAKVAQIAAVTTTAEMFENIADIIRVLHVGVAALDPSVTVEAMIDDTDPNPTRMAELLATMNAVLRRSGMTEGEAQAPSA